MTDEQQVDKQVLSSAPTAVDPLAGFKVVSFGSPRKKQKVIVRGPAMTISGYGVHIRQIFRWAHARPDFDVVAQPTPWGMTPWMVREDMCDGLIGKVMQCSRPVEGAADVSFQVQLPNEWDVSAAKFNVGVTAAVETDRCPSGWAKNCAAMDAVIVPSAHTRDVLVGSGAPSSKITVVPEAFPDAILADVVKPFGAEFPSEFNYLVVGQFTGNSAKTDRKNMGNTIAWLIEAFRGDASTGIVIKTNMGKNTKIDRSICDRTIKEIVASVRGDAEFPKVHLIHGHVTDEEMAGLYRHPRVKAFALATRGEGFGLPILEAAASGLPIVATNWSGYLDFMNQGKFIRVDYSLRDVHESRIDSIFVKGARWAEPDKEDFIRKVRKLRSSYSTPSEWARDLRKKLIESNSYAAVAKQYDAFVSSKLGW